MTDAPPLLEVKHLRVEFPTRRGTLTAVDDVSFAVAPGEILGVVGESGAGKSLTGAAIIGLIEPPGRIASGEIFLEGSRIDGLPPEAMRRIRGRRIGAIFQDPLTSLNPLYTIGRQITETILAHLPVSRRGARERALALLGEVGIPAPVTRLDHYPHQFSGGYKISKLDCSIKYSYDTPANTYLTIKSQDEKSFYITMGCDGLAKSQYYPVD